MTTRRGLALIPPLFLLLSVAEITVFLTVVHAIGALWAVTIIAVSTITGVLLLRREGVRGWRAFQAAATEGRPPGPQVSDSLVGLLGALLLATPGLVSTAAGVLLLLPGMRHLARRGVERATTRRVPADVAGDLFGPRRVKVHSGEPAPETETARPGPVIQGEVVEGEIVR